MSDESPVSLSKTAEPEPAPPTKRRLAVAVAACLAAAVLVAVALVWEPWVDKSPFTARSFSAGGKALFTDNGDGTCVPDDAGKKARLLGEDRQLLAEGRFSPHGEILISGPAAGSCLYHVEFKNVPGGQDAYYVERDTKFYTEDGKVSDPALSEEDLRSTPDEAKEQYSTMKAPRDYSLPE
ncbi:hypothetical protein ACWDMR_00030 [Streptomyces althioticus]